MAFIATSVYVVCGAFGLTSPIPVKGVHATNNEQLRRAAGVSGSQLTHYFPTKESLVVAVIECQAQSVLAFHRSERFTHFRDGLERMQRLGRLSAEADPTRLAYLLLSAFQGGMLLAQIARDIAPLENTLHAAIDHVQTFAVPPTASMNDGATAEAHEEALD